jgi:hypothetical protein
MLHNQMATASRMALRVLLPVLPLQPPHLAISSNFAAAHGRPRHSQSPRYNMNLSSAINILWCKQWPYCVPRQGRVFGVAWRVKLLQTLMHQPAVLPVVLLPRKYSHHLPASPLQARMLTRATLLKSSSTPTLQPRPLARAPYHLRRQPPPSCSRRHRHLRRLWVLSLIRTTEAF